MLFVTFNVLMLISGYHFQRGIYVTELGDSIGGRKGCMYVATSKSNPNWKLLHEFCKNKVFYIYISTKTLHIVGVCSLQLNLAIGPRQGNFIPQPPFIRVPLLFPSLYKDPLHFT